jgi:hypothetical protein
MPDVIVIPQRNVPLYLLVFAPVQIKFVCHDCNVSCLLHTAANVCISVLPELGWTCGTHRGGERCSQVLVGRPEGKRSLGRPRRRWEDNIKMDRSPLAGFCEHGDEPSVVIKKAGYFLIGQVTTSFSNNILHYGVSD